MIKCDPRAKAKCPFKEQCCGYDVGYFLEGSDCDKFNQNVPFPVSWTVKMKKKQKALQK